MQCALAYIGLTRFVLPYERVFLIAVCSIKVPPFPLNQRTQTHGTAHALRLSSMLGRVMALIVVFPILPFVLTATELCSMISGGNYLDFFPAELALKLSEYFGSIWRVGVNRRVFLPPFSAAFVTAEPLPALFWFVSTPTIIAELHTFLSTVI